jgi:hypothetical protein
MKTFSLLVPTRNRPDFLIAYLESIEKTVKNPNRITVLIAYDDDDIVTRDLIPTIKPYPFKVKWCKRGRTNFINQDYYNWLAKQSFSEDSDYFFINADDIRLFVVVDFGHMI